MVRNPRRLFDWCRPVTLACVALGGCGSLRHVEDGNSYTIAAEPLFVTSKQVAEAIAHDDGTATAPAASSRQQDAPVVHALITALHGGDDVKRQFIGAVLMDSEAKCGQFLNRLGVAQNGVNATGDILTTILSGVATAVAPISLAHGFAAAATIVSGTKTALDQDFWAKAGVQDFQKALSISYYYSIRDYTGKIQTQSDINLPLELEKIQSIHGLCTVGSAMNTISATLSASSAPAGEVAKPDGGDAAAGATAAASTTAIAVPGLSVQSYVSAAQLHHAPYAASSEAAAIRHWLRPSYVSQGPTGAWLDASGHPAPADPGHVAALRRWLDGNKIDGVAVPIQTFITDPDLAGLRARAVAEIPIPTIAH